MVRQRNPEVFFASWSSSGPVKTQVDGSVYYSPIQLTLPSNCSADVHAAITYADNILLEGSLEDIALVKRAIYYTRVLNPKGNTSFPNYPGPDELNYWEIASIPPTSSKLLSSVSKASDINPRSLNSAIN